MAEKEIKLSGKLDLSMWRGGGDWDDDDSSTELSPLPVSPSNHNFANDNVCKPTLPTTQTQAQRTGAVGISSSSASTDFHQSIGVLTTTEPKTTAPVIPSQINEQSQLPLSQSQLQIVDKSTQQEERPASTTLQNEESTSRKEQWIKGGVKKVEFAEEGKSSMYAEGNLQSAFGDGKEKALKGQIFGKRHTRSPSGSLLNEIRKMSLASQDAEEERRKQASLATNPTKRVRRVRRRKREEEYTDKDRAAAVTLGSRDIKQSLKAKKKRERKMRLSLDFMSSEEYLASALVVEAMYQLKARKTPEAALATLNKALELQPTHKGALVARSQCHIRMGDANSALKDAETSFGKNEVFIQGLYQYSEALYQLGEFEKALIAFHQGHRLRKDMEGFRIGVQKSQEAIKRAIGDRSATQMSNLDEILSIIEELQESKRKAADNCKDEELLLNIMKKKFGDKLVATNKMQSKPKNKIITKEVLGQMYRDKEYLAKFVNRPEVKQQMENAEALRETAKEGLKYLESREKFWRQQNPLYSRKTMTGIINNNSLLSKLNSPATSSVSTRRKSLPKLEQRMSQLTLQPKPSSRLLNAHV